MKDDSNTAAGSGWMMRFVVPSSFCDCLGDANEVVNRASKAVHTIIVFLAVSLLRFFRCSAVCALVIWMPVRGGEFYRFEVSNNATNPPPSETTIILDGGNPPSLDGFERRRGLGALQMSVVNLANQNPVMSAPGKYVLPNVKAVSEIKSDQAGEEAWKYRVVKYLHSVNWLCVILTGLIGFALGLFHERIVDLIDFTKRRLFLHNGKHMHHWKRYGKALSGCRFKLG